MPNRWGVMEQGSRVMELDGGHMGTRQPHPACVTYEAVTLASRPGGYSGNYRFHKPKGDQWKCMSQRVLDLAVL